MSRFAVVSLVFSLFLFPALPSFAAPPTDPLDKAYQRILDNPGDKDALVQYANMAIERKNYEAAIPPLECILLSEPDYADLQIAIGSLYLALGSKSMAKKYFEEVTDNPDASDENIKQAKGYLDAL